MKPRAAAIGLEAQAATLRRMAAGIRKSGFPVDVALKGRRFPLDQLTAEDLDDDAAAFEADAKKLRTLYA